VALFTDYLASRSKIDAPVAFWTPAIVAEFDIPALRPRSAMLANRSGAGFAQRPHLFRFAIMSLCTSSRPQAIIDFDPPTPVGWTGGLIDLVPTSAPQPLTPDPAALRQAPICR
jgi:hypothetical protein